MSAIATMQDRVANNKPSTGTTKYLAWVRYSSFALLLLIIVACAVWVNRYIHSTPRAPVVVDPSGLTQAQYSTLSEMMHSAGAAQFYTADIEAIGKLAGQMSWVQDVDVSRDWHRGIVVRVHPRLPIARFGSERLVDASGIVFIPAEKKELLQHDLATLYGDDAYALEMMRQMQMINKWFLPLNIKVTKMALTPRQTWVIYFNNGLHLVVDYENTSQKLFSLSRLLQGSLKSRFFQIQAVDLRYKNGFAITWRSQQ